MLTQFKEMAEGTGFPAVWYGRDLEAGGWMQDDFPAPENYGICYFLFGLALWDQFGAFSIAATATKPGWRKGGRGDLSHIYEDGGCG